MSVKSLLTHSFMVAWKDLMELFRNKMGLAMLVVMPIFMMGMVGFIFPSSSSMGHVTIGLANEDQGYGGYLNAGSALATGLEEINNSTGQMTITHASSLSEVQDMIQRGAIDGGIVISRNFSSSIASGKQGTIIVVTDETNPQMSAVMRTSMTTLFQQIGTQVARRNVEWLSQDVNASNSLAVVAPYNVQTEGAVAGTFNYFDFMAPGLMAMTVMMSVMTGLPAAISHEREVGTLDGMMVAPINRLAVVLGKTLAQTARGLLQGTLILVLSMALFGVTIHGSILLIFALLLLGVFSFVGIGIVLTSFTKDQETATMLMTSIMFPMMFLSGVFFPIQQMPWFMQNISQMLPLTYAATALRKVMVFGAGVPAITTELTILITLGIIMTIIAVPVFKRAMTR